MQKNVARKPYLKAVTQPELGCGVKIEKIML